MTTPTKRLCGCPAAEPVYECSDPECGCGLDGEETGDCVCGHHLDDHVNGAGECMVQVEPGLGEQ